MRVIARYFRSPEFVLAITNFAVMVLLFAYEQIDYLIEWIIEPFGSAVILGNLGYTIGAVVFFFVTAPLLLPLTTVVWIAAVFEFIMIDDYNTLLVVSAPNAVLWGFGAAFFFRLLHTYDLVAARSATLRWRTGRQYEPVSVCPHCGQKMPLSSKDDGKPQAQIEPQG